MLFSPQPFTDDGWWLAGLFDINVNFCQAEAGLMGEAT